MKTVLVHDRATPPVGETAASEPPATAPPLERVLPQLGLGGIIAVWAAAALPMGLLAWVVAPAIADHLNGPGALSRALIITLTAGLVWQFVLVMFLVRREQGTLRWSVLKGALWLRAPRAPRTGRRGGRTWLVVLPLLIVFAAEELVPGLPHAASRDLGDFLGSHAGHVLLAGSWGWFGILAVMFVFNTVLGEELLFRGYLLPRMNGVFGRRDWLANGVLFAVYHLHVPWVIPAPLLMPVEAYAAKRYRSALIGIAVHSAQSVVFLALALSLVLKG
jgi:membrane protease YdiL (CAAX protease family)